jgi:hypothetical protein
MPGGPPLSYEAAPTWHAVPSPAHIRETPPTWHPAPGRPFSAWHAVPGGPPPTDTASWQAVQGGPPPADAASWQAVPGGVFPGPRPSDWAGPEQPGAQGGGAAADEHGGDQRAWLSPHCACTVREGDPHPAEAAALAAAFAADYLSWDEDDPDLRAHVLGEYLAARRPVLLGWSGQGRQRADFAVPGVVRPDGDGRVIVDVRVRVTPYRRVPGGRPLPPDDPEDDGPTVPAAAPAPAARGWRGLPGRWVRLSVAVLAAGDRLVVDAEDESEDPWVEPAPELADDLPEETP